MVQLELRARTWGGRREGAGRKAGKGRRATPHRARGPHYGGHPVHLTLRMRRELGSLRRRLVYQAVLGAIVASSKECFRITHFSVQDDHLHLIVEADGPGELASGAKGLNVRLAAGINRVLDRRGPVCADRYHTRALTTPLEVRNAIVYVLMNVKKHQPRCGLHIDHCSSAPWFDGFEGITPRPDPPTWAPRTWLAREGWRQHHGLIRTTEAPRLASALPPSGLPVRGQTYARIPSTAPPPPRIPRHQSCSAACGWT